MPDLTRLREMLPQILGAAGGLTGGGSGFSKRWAELQAQEQQRQQQAQQQQVQKEQLGFQRDANTRAQSADVRAGQDQLMQTVNSVRGFLGDESIETPEAYAQREAMMLGLAPRMGVDAGFIQSLRPAPTVYQQRAAKKKLDQIGKTYSPAQMQMLEADDQTGAAPLFEVGGERLTIAQLRERVGTQAVSAEGKPMAMRPPAKPDPATPGSFEEYVGLPPETQAQRRQQRKEYMQADDRPITVNTGAAENRTNTRVDRVVNTFNSHPIVKEYNEVQAQQGIIKQVVGSQWSGPGDMAAVFAFMKALDPNSVVRETEYANAAKSGNIFQGWAARFNGAINPNGGFLSDRVRQDFLRTINSRMDVKTKQYQNLRRQLAQRVDRIKAGAPETGDEALVDYTGGGEQAAPPRAQKPTTGNPFRERGNAGSGR